MSFLAPLAFTLAALLPAIVALYFLKLRREEQVVSSTYLWQELVRDVAANAPWQRLRVSWLLLLQLLFLGALIVALARPFSWTVAATGSHLILVIDTSASMAAVDVRPDRLGAAVEQARRLAAGLPADAPVTLIAAGDEARVLLSASRDRGRLSAVLEELQTYGGSDMATALELASAIAAGEPDAQVAILSDGGVRLPERWATSADVRYLPVGSSGENQAVSALSLDPGAAGQGLSVFVRASNYGARPIERRLTLHAHLSGAAGPEDGLLVTARDLALPPGDSAVLTVPDLPAGTVAVEARLEGEDVLASDDRAWAVAPTISGAQIQIVGSGNRFLETALALLPGVEVTTIGLEAYEAGQRASEPVNGSGTESPNWLTIFDGVLPEAGLYPPGALLFVGPLRSSEFFSVTGVLEAPLPRPASADEALLRYVDLQDVVVGRAARLALPAWGRPVIVAGGESGQGAPLLVAGEMPDGRRLAVLAFDLRQSDLPLRVAFPLLLANLVDFLAPGSGGTVPSAAALGQPLSIPLPPQAEGASVTRPDGRQERLAVDAGTARFDATDTPGVYEVAWEAAGEQWPLGRFAVNSFSPQESDLAPRPELPIAGQTGETVTADRPVRREWWPPIAWAALVLLVAEWLVQYRGGLVWLRRLGPT